MTSTIHTTYIEYKEAIETALTEKKLDVATRLMDRLVDYETRRDFQDYCQLVEYAASLQSLEFSRFILSWILNACKTKDMTLYFYDTVPEQLITLGIKLNALESFAETSSVDLLTIMIRFFEFRKTPASYNDERHSSFISSGLDQSIKYGNLTCLQLFVDHSGWVNALGPVLNTEDLALLLSRILHNSMGFTIKFNLSMVKILLSTWCAITQRHCFECFLTKALETKNYPFIHAYRKVFPKALIGLGFTYSVINLYGDGLSMNIFDDHAQDWIRTWKEDIKQECLAHIPMTKVLVLMMHSFC